MQSRSPRLSRTHRGAGRDLILSFDAVVFVFFLHLLFLLLCHIFVRDGDAAAFVCVCV